MIVGDRLRELREEKNLSQGDIEKRTGLLRCYISRVENGHTVPAVETLEKFARALEVPIYQLFYEGDKKTGPGEEITRGPDGISRKGARQWRRFLRVLGQMSEKDRGLLMELAQKMARKERD